VRPLFNLLLALLIAIALAEAASLAGQIALRRGLRYDDEIRWLEAFEPVRFWDAGRHAQLDRRYRERVERELRAGRLDAHALEG